MSWLNNFKVVYKIALIVALLGAVTLGSVGYATQVIKTVDDASDDLVKRLSVSMADANQAFRYVERYLSLAFQMAAETTEDNDAKFKANIAEAKGKYESTMKKVQENRPELSNIISPVIAGFSQVVKVCDPAIAFLGEAKTPEDNVKATERLKAECVPPAEKLIDQQTKLVSDMQAATQQIDDRNGEAVDAALRTVWIASGLGLLLGLSLALLVGIKGLSQPMTRLNAAMGQMAGGDLDTQIPGTERGDEIGAVAKTVLVIRENAERKAQADLENKTRQDQVIAQQRKADMTRLADGFQASVGQIVDTVSKASGELETSAKTLSATSDRAQELTTIVRNASEEASANVQSVASATEELSSSVNEISRQVQESTRIANDAVEQARNTTGRVSELSKAATRIGDVIELINTIAGQTNLLALNATIEAARAGEAGRGFAVVASEVKALAEQTAKATGDIGQQISGIQAATQDSVNAIKEISGTIEKLSEISSAIAAAVEEQGAATQEIARNVQQTAQGTHAVSSNAADVQRGASETGTASSQVLSAAQSLSRDSSRLRSEVETFLSNVRAS